ncbi:hypothetical protein N7490_011735 [Penicillium lividum]|nr:hypothetical protein N7490_011735 [Penicillium lividum]
MPSNPDKFYEERELLFRKLNMLVVYTNDITKKDLEWSMFVNLKEVKNRIEALIEQEADTMDETNKLIAERCTDYIVMVGTQLIREPVDRDYVFPELIHMIKMQVGRLRLGGWDDPLADSRDRQAEELDVKYKVRTPAAIFTAGWMYLNLYYHSTTARW